MRARIISVLAMTLFAAGVIAYLAQLAGVWRG